MNQQRPFTVGLTGGIGSGKSTVADLFAERGIPVVDADEAARAVVAPGSEGLAEVVARFGEAVLAADGSLDRAALRRRIFQAPEEREALEALLHPRIRAWMEERTAAAEGPWVLQVIPLLVEKGWADRLDRVLVVEADPAEQVQRAARRDGTEPGEVEAIRASQATPEERRAVADDILRNDDRGALAEGVAQLDAQYRALAARGGEED
jgi:dephospho-CoA kinase